MFCCLCACTRSALQTRRSYLRCNKIGSQRISTPSTIAPNGKRKQTPTTEQLLRALCQDGYGWELFSRAQAGKLPNPAGCNSGTLYDDKKSTLHKKNKDLKKHRDLKRNQTRNTHNTCDKIGVIRCPCPPPLLIAHRQIRACSRLNVVRDALTNYLKMAGTPARLMFLSLHRFDLLQRCCHKKNTWGFDCESVLSESFVSSVGFVLVPVDMNASFVFKIYMQQTETIKRQPRKPCWT